MDLIAERVEVWAASLEDKPGSLANILSSLREAGANLNFILARREPDQPGKSVVYVTPLAGDAELEAAATLGFNLTARVYSVRVEGQNQPGIAAGLASKLAAAGLNLRGFSAAVLGTRFILYIGLDSVEDAAKALTVLQSV
ncbi:MAG: amino acid-binding protein [Candidatus Contendobacter sp.]|nr:amino acid-binding protein [Gammaproteobacteria bacterium]MCC8992101.1 amino acid-binding protein [Candidatus Contendobacter sp.]